MGETTASQLAEYVRTRRLRAGLSQETLAERAGLTVDTVGAVERGLRRRLYPHTARAIAEALGLSASEWAELAELAHGRSAAHGAPPTTAGSEASDTTRSHHNLPTPLTRLIGRERELAQIEDLLAQARLLTLTGTGGIGKTRLAIEAAHALLPRYTHGVWLVDLAPLAGPALVLGAVAAALGVREAPGQPLLTTLTNALRDRQQLHLLDNCEQVLDAAPDLAALLGACPALSMLATSRAPLRISGEHELLVPPLLTPTGLQHESVAMVAQYAAVQLFVERAAAVQAEFALTQQNAPAVAAICARLDGLPLAIELAAARVKLFEPWQLLARLEQRLPLLTGGARDRPARQRTLRSAIAWSYDLLSESEQAIFRQLGVFVGGFTLSAAEAVCAGGDGEALDLVDAVEALQHWSLVQQDDAVSAPPDLSVAASAPVATSLSEAAEAADGAQLPAPDEPEPRFTMFETIREYALEQLTARGEAERWQKRHVDYYLGLLEGAAAGLQETVPFTTVWRTRRSLMLEYGNLQAALNWSIAHGCSEDALRLTASLCTLWVPTHNLRVSRFWLDQPAGVLREAQRSLEQSLALVTEHPPSPALQAARARALHALGRILVAEWESGIDQRAAATRAFDEGLALYRGLDDRPGIAGCVFGLGVAYFDLEEFSRAREAFEESLALGRALGTPTAIGWPLLGLGRIALLEGDGEHAVALFLESLEQQRLAGNLLGVAGALDALGLADVARGDYAAAVGHHEQALTVRRALGVQSGVARSLYQLGVLLGMSGDTARSAVLLRESLVLGQRMGNPWDIMIALLSLGGLLGTTGSLELGARLLGAGQGLAERKGLQVPVTYQQIYERTVLFVQRQLGEEAFAAYRAAGMALSVDEAVAEALQHTLPG